MLLPPERVTAVQELKPAACRRCDVARELLGANFGGTLVSGRWCGYAWVDVTRRQLCWAHLLRHFKAFEDYGPHARRLGKALQRATRKIFHELHRVRDGTIQHGTFRVVAAVEASLHGLPAPSLLTAHPLALAAA